MIVIRVNEVIVTRIAGRNEISVSRRTTCSGAEIVPIPFTWRSRLFTAGTKNTRINARRQIRNSQELFELGVGSWRPDAAVP